MSGTGEEHRHAARDTTRGVTLPRSAGLLTEPLTVDGIGDLVQRREKPCPPSALRATSRGKIGESGGVSMIGGKTSRAQYGIMGT